MTGQTEGTEGTLTVIISFMKLGLGRLRHPKAQTDGLRRQSPSLIVGFTEVWSQRRILGYVKLVRTEGYKLEGSLEDRSAESCCLTQTH